MQLLTVVVVRLVLGRYFYGLDGGRGGVVAVGGFVFEAWYHGVMGYAKSDHGAVLQS